MTELEKIEKDLEVAEEKYNKVFSNASAYPTLQEYLDALEPYRDVLMALSRKKRLIMPYELKPIPKDAHVMSMEEFIEAVQEEWFIDEDGSGNYAKDGKMSDIDILPSDVEYGAIRKDFDSVVWFNK